MEFSKEISKLGYKYKSGGSRGFYFIAGYVPKVGLLRKNPKCVSYFEVHTNCELEVTLYTLTYRSEKGDVVSIEGTGDETLQKFIDTIREINEQRMSK